jgi:hypothetical protein
LNLNKSFEISSLSINDDASSPGIINDNNSIITTTTNNNNNNSNAYNPVHRSNSFVKSKYVNLHLNVNDLEHNRSKSHGYPESPSTARVPTTPLILTPSNASIKTLPLISNKNCNEINGRKNSIPVMRNNGIFSQNNLYPYNNKTPSIHRSSSFSKMVHSAIAKRSYSDIWELKKSNQNIRRPSLPSHIQKQNSINYNNNEKSISLNNLHRYNNNVIHDEIIEKINETLLCLDHFQVAFNKINISDQMENQSFDSSIENIKKERSNSNNSNETY